MKLLKKSAVVIIILPLTLLLDLVLFAFLKNCPSCGSFWEFVKTEGALSFPIVVSFVEATRAALGGLQGQPIKDKT